MAPSGSSPAPRSPELLSTGHWNTEAHLTQGLTTHSPAHSSSHLGGSSPVKEPHGRGFLTPLPQETTWWELCKLLGSTGMWQVQGVGSSIALEPGSGCTSN